MTQQHKPFSLPEREEEILKYWREERTFEMSMKRRKRKRAFVFFEGPPSANGRPGIHHVLSRVYKDAVCRYKTMKGFYVERKAGWDTHGLPIELQVEKELELTNKKDIEQYGIGKFNDMARQTVWRYKEEWERLTERIGFWLDQEHPYVTYEPSYIEAIWHLVSATAKKKLLYQDFKVVPYCPRCGTALSSHEVAQGYKTVKDNSVTAKFQLAAGQKIKNGKDEFHIGDNAYILSWTTTPWTLPGNVALAVGENIDYALVQHEGEVLIAAVATLGQLGLHAAEVLFRVRGKELLKLRYEPLFDVEELRSKKSYHVYPADFVNTEDGTGVVHTAVMYGEDDFVLGAAIGLPKIHTVDEEGKFVGDYAAGLKGSHVKSIETEIEIFKYLHSNNLLFKKERYEHEYPHCWRCDHALLYYAKSSWFIGVSKLRKQLVANNKKVNWVPQHIKDGRFGEWLKEAKDWALSRERYWGTPLPVWRCEDCDTETVIGSLGELDKRSAKKLNTYFFLRHGEAVSNKEGFVSSWPEARANSLTPDGIAQVRKLLPRLKKEKIDFIFSSDLERTKETAEIVADALGVRVVYDERLRENDMGSENGNSIKEWREYMRSKFDQYTIAFAGGETLTQVQQRMMAVVTELNHKHEGKNILIVSHGSPILSTVIAHEGYAKRDIVSIEEKLKLKRTGTFVKVHGHNWPYNASGDLDLHRPYIDEITIKCKKCSGVMQRVPEVMDVWFDSGAMPFAQYGVEKMKYPADFITEGVDQTRGWFYTLHTIGTLMGKGPAYKNVISLGHVLDEEGDKMSKSKGNVVDPWEVIQTYGVDAMRWYFFAVNAAGESKYFAVGDIAERLRRVLLTIWNIQMFYSTYATHEGVKNANAPEPILDQWMRSRAQHTIAETGNVMEAYDLTTAARAIEGLVDDCSRWWLRRSRRRFQHPESAEDVARASVLLYETLRVLAELMAPLAPFFAEIIYREIGMDTSVHHADYPKANVQYMDKKLEEQMDEVRRVTTLALAARAKSGIKVRQPLATLSINGKKVSIDDVELLNLIKDEVNVKAVAFGAALTDEIELDTTLTADLKHEGFVREIMRNIQEMRRDLGLQPDQEVRYYLDGDPAHMMFLEQYRDMIERDTNASAIPLSALHSPDADRELILDEYTITIKIAK